MRRFFLLLGVAIGLVVTNPTHAAYETYAVEQITNLAKEQCNRAPSKYGILLQEPCRTAIEVFKPHLGLLVLANTQRHNWYFVSFYRSDISIPAANFNGQLETIGILNNFYTYKTP
jgi:Domain of unknown function (DUF4359)